MTADLSDTILSKKDYRHDDNHKTRHKPCLLQADYTNSVFLILLSCLMHSEMVS